MQGIRGLASRRELGLLAAGMRACRSGWSCRQEPVFCPGRRLLLPGAAQSRSSSGSPGSSGSPLPPRGSGRRPAISVVGIPDPLTWIRCKVISLLVDLYFQIDLNSQEFESGAKQALVLVSSKMSRGRYHELVGLVSKEMVEYLEDKCKCLPSAQRTELAVGMDDIIFSLPEDVSVVFDQHGRKFCSVAMRFWHLSSHEGPDDPEGTKIFKVGAGEEDGPKKKISTAVYEFHGELTHGAHPEWTITTVWHWNWRPAE
ncbi:m-AAA protease-interacting protein 1, mitochondrial [Cololabis saira]|uniref:m-AAA protease-interacting protein 1, mitochondrial n=1 Tax=Cololabis saira TaxID=129043 RepID=UPI002AD38FFE|nr:m-AAA protease-interacting protein 1, mitochondrial [Cololabis saira]